MDGSSMDWSELEKDLYTPGENWSIHQIVNLRSAINSIKHAEKAFMEALDLSEGDLATFPEFIAHLIDIADLYEVVDIDSLLKAEKEIDLPLPHPDDASDGGGGFGGYL